MATRGRPKSDEKRQQILDAAVELFTQHGYEQTNVDRVAAAAGVSKQTIYSHFSGKTDLLKECIKRRCEEGRITGDDLDYGQPPRVFLREFAERFIVTTTEEGPLRMYRLVMSESDRHPEVGRSFWDSGPRPTVQAFSEYLRRANARGELSVEHPAMASSQYILMIKGLFVDTALGNLGSWPFSFTMEEYLDSCVEMFMRAYGPDDDSGAQSETHRTAELA